MIDKRQIISHTTPMQTNTNTTMERPSRRYPGRFLQTMVLPSKLKLIRLRSKVLGVSMSEYIRNLIDRDLSPEGLLPTEPSVGGNTRS